MTEFSIARLDRSQVDSAQLIEEVIASEHPRVLIRLWHVHEVIERLKQLHGVDVKKERDGRS